jgi:hypothetical protein
MSASLNMDPHAEAIDGITDPWANCHSSRESARVFREERVAASHPMVRGPLTGLDIPAGQREMKWNGRRWVDVERQRRVENVLLGVASVLAVLAVAALITWWVTGAMGWLS